MQYASQRIFLRSVIVIALVLFQSACAMWGATERTATRGKLSGAMEKASDHYEGPRVVSAPAENSRQEHDDPRVNTQPEAVTHRMETHELPPFHFRGVAFSRGSSLHTDNHFQLQESYEISSVSSGFDPLDDFLRLYLRFDSAYLKPDHERYDAIDGSVVTLAAGFAVKGFRSRINRYLTSYAIGGLSWGFTTWDYRNAFSASDGTVISDDGVFSFDIYGGAGVSFTPTKYLALSMELGPRITLWGDVTQQEFENDVFSGDAALFLTFDMLLGNH